MFTDESRFSLRSPDGRERVWRRPQERFAECTFSPRVGYQGGSLMVWAGISLETRTEVYIIPRGYTLMKFGKILLFLMLILLEMILF